MARAKFDRPFLVGLYPPTAGRILIDGQDLQGLDPPTCQQRLGVVSQDIFLLNDNMTLNITFGTPNLIW